MTNTRYSRVISHNVTILTAVDKPCGDPYEWFDAIRDACSVIQYSLKRIHAIKDKPGRGRLQRSVDAGDRTGQRVPVGKAGPNLMLPGIPNRACFDGVSGAAAILPR